MADDAIAETPTLTAGDTLLRYALLAAPDPLQAGVAATLTLVASARGDSPVVCRRIVLEFPLGAHANDLFVKDGDLKAELPPGWEVTGEEGGGGESLRLIFHPLSGGATLDGQGLTFTVAPIPINAEPGTAALTLWETAAPAAGHDQTVSTPFLLTKFPPQFRLDDLVADPLSVPAGGATLLSWDGSAEAGGGAIGYALHYQPHDSGPPVVVDPVAAAGSHRAEGLTRSGSVTFTLVARVPAAGRDTPRIVQRQVTVSTPVAAPAEPLTMRAEPGTVGVGGLVRLAWDAPGADHCLLDGDVVLPASGTLYRVLSATRQFTISAVAANGGPIATLQRRVVVDPAIVATEAGFTITGTGGSAGPANGSAGGRGGDAVLRRSLPPLGGDGAARVIPISVVGGVGGTGGGGVAIVPFISPPPPWIEVAAGKGGRGGDAIVDVTLDEAGAAPAHYLIVAITPGAGGAGGTYGNIGGGGPPGEPGSRALTIDGQAVTLA